MAVIAPAQVNPNLLVIPLNGTNQLCSLCTVSDFTGNGYKKLVVGDTTTPETVNVYEGTGPAGGAPALLTSIPAQAAFVGNGFGAATVNYGKWNGSAADAIVVGAPYPAAGNNGHVFIFDSASGAQYGATLQAFTPTGALVAQNYYGRAIAVIGDLNGDGHAEVAIGAPGWQTAGTIDIGLVEVVDVYNNALLKVIRPPAGFPVLAPAGGMAFGQTLVALGDLNGDGYGDLAVGAPGSGVVFVYSGASLVPGGGQPPVTGYCRDTMMALGWSMTASSDLNGDNVADLVVGAISLPATPIAGYVMAYSGQALMQAGGAQVNGIYPAAGLEGRWVGYSVARIRDCNGDGVGDFCVGAPSPGAPTVPSRVYLRSGLTGGNLSQSSASSSQYGAVVFATGNLSPGLQPTVMIADWSAGVVYVRVP